MVIADGALHDHQDRLREAVHQLLESLAGAIAREDSQVGISPLGVWGHESNIGRGSGSETFASACGFPAFADLPGAGAALEILAGGFAATRPGPAENRGRATEAAR